MERITNKIREVERKERILVLYYMRWLLLRRWFINNRYQLTTTIAHIVVIAIIVWINIQGMRLLIIAAGIVAMVVLRMAREKLIHN